MKVYQLPKVMINPIDRDIVKLREACVTSTIPHDFSYALMKITFNQQKLINKTFPDHTLRMSAWKDSFTRITEDQLLEATTNSVIFALDNYVSFDNATKLNVVHLYFDLIDSFSSIPFASATTKVVVPLTPSTGKETLYTASEEISASFQCNYNIENLSRSFRENDLKISIELKTFHSLANLFNLPHVREANNYRMVVPYPLGAFNVVHNMHERRGCLHITVDDMQLNADILELYAKKIILVRVTSKSSLFVQKKGFASQQLFVGSIANLEGVWLEANEWKETHPLDRLEIEVFSASYNNKDRTFSAIDEDSHLLTSMLCQGTIKPEHLQSTNRLSLSPHILSDGTYEVGLYTTIKSPVLNQPAFSSSSSMLNRSGSMSPLPATTNTKVQVGRVKLRISADLNVIKPDPHYPKDPSHIIETNILSITQKIQMLTFTSVSSSLCMNGNYQDFINILFTICEWIYELLYTDAEDMISIHHNTLSIPKVLAKLGSLLNDLFQRVLSYGSSLGSMAIVHEILFHVSMSIRATTASVGRIMTVLQWYFQQWIGLDKSQDFIKQHLLSYEKLLGNLQPENALHAIVPTLSPAAAAKLEEELLQKYQQISAVQEEVLDFQKLQQATIAILLCKMIVKQYSTTSLNTLWIPSIDLITINQLEFHNEVYLQEVLMDIVTVIRTYQDNILYALTLLNTTLVLDQEQKEDISSATPNANTKAAMTTPITASMIHQQLVLFQTIHQWQQLLQYYNTERNNLDVFKHYALNEDEEWCLRYCDYLYQFIQSITTAHTEIKLKQEDQQILFFLWKESMVMINQYFVKLITIATATATKTQGSDLNERYLTLLWRGLAMIRQWKESTELSNTKTITIQLSNVQKQQVSLLITSLQDNLLAYVTKVLKLPVLKSDPWEEEENDANAEKKSIRKVKIHRHQQPSDDEELDQNEEIQMMCDQLLTFQADEVDDNNNGTETPQEESKGFSSSINRTPAASSLTLSVQEEKPSLTVPSIADIKPKSQPRFGADYVTQSQNPAFDASATPKKSNAISSLALSASKMKIDELTTPVSTKVPFAVNRRLPKSAQKNEVFVDEKVTAESLQVQNTVTEGFQIGSELLLSLSKYPKLLHTISRLLYILFELQNVRTLSLDSYHRNKDGAGVNINNLLGMENLIKTQQLVINIYNILFEHKEIQPNKMKKLILSYWQTSQQDDAVNTSIREGIILLGYFTSIMIPLHGKLSEITISFCQSQQFKNYKQMKTVPRVELWMSITNQLYRNLLIYFGYSAIFSPVEKSSSLSSTLKSTAMGSTTQVVLEPVPTEYHNVTLDSDSSELYCTLSAVVTTANVQQLQIHCNTSMYYLYEYASHMLQISTFTAAPPNAPMALVTPVKTTTSLSVQDPDELDNTLVELSSIHFMLSHILDTFAFIHRQILGIPIMLEQSLLWRKIYASEKVISYQLSFMLDHVWKMLLFCHKQYYIFPNEFIPLIDSMKVRYLNTLIEVITLTPMSTMMTIVNPAGNDSTNPLTSNDLFVIWKQNYQWYLKPIIIQKMIRYLHAQTAVMIGGGNGNGNEPSRNEKLLSKNNLTTSSSDIFENILNTVSSTITGMDGLSVLEFLHQILPPDDENILNAKLASYSNLYEGSNVQEHFVYEFLQMVMMIVFSSLQSLAGNNGSQKGGNGNGGGSKSTLVIGPQPSVLYELSYELIVLFLAVQGEGGKVWSKIATHTPAVFQDWLQTMHMQALSTGIGYGLYYHQLHKQSLTRQFASTSIPTTPAVMNMPPGILSNTTATTPPVIVSTPPPGMSSKEETKLIQLFKKQLESFEKLIQYIPETASAATTTITKPMDFPRMNKILTKSMANYWRTYSNQQQIAYCALLQFCCEHRLVALHTVLPITAPTVPATTVITSTTTSRRKSNTAAAVPPTFDFHHLSVIQEQEVIALRKCLKQLLSAGYWESGLHIATYYQQYLLIFMNKVNHMKEYYQQFQRKNQYIHITNNTNTSSMGMMDGAGSSSSSSSLSPLNPASHASMVLSPLRSNRSLGNTFGGLDNTTTRSGGVVLTPFSPVRNGGHFFNGSSASTSSVLPATPATSNTSLLLGSPLGNKSQRKAPAPPNTPLVATNAGSSSVHYSPKRTESHQLEIKRFISKFKDKIHHDQFLRQPSQYFAIRLLSSQEITIQPPPPSNTTSSSSSSKNTGKASTNTPPTTSQSPFSLICIQQIQTLHLLNIETVYHPISTGTSTADGAGGGSGDGSGNGGNTGEYNMGLGNDAQGHQPWHEVWLLWKIDMSSYMNNAIFYRDFLEASAAHLYKNPTDIYDLQTLISPLAYAQIIEQVQSLYPGYIFLPTSCQIESIINLNHPVYGTDFTASTLQLKYFQCFPAIPAQLQQNGIMNSFFTIGEKQIVLPANPYQDDDKSTTNDEEDEDEDSDEEDDDDDDDDDATISSGQASITSSVSTATRRKKLQKRRRQQRKRKQRKMKIIEPVIVKKKILIVKPDLDKEYINFVDCPNTFYIYLLRSDDITLKNPSHELVRYTLSCIRPPLPIHSYLYLEQHLPSTFYGAMYTAGSGNMKNDATMSDMDRSAMQLLPAEGMISMDKKEWRLQALHLSPLVHVLHTQTVYQTYMQSAMEILAHQIIILERAYRGIEHVNDLTATELSNQPEISILHSDSFFYYIVYLFCVLLETPNSYCIGINHLDLVLANEQERIDLEWQNIRKHAKRDYMRDLQLYEEELAHIQEEKLKAASAPAATPDPPSTGKVKFQSIANRIKNASKVVSVMRREKPKEPDLDSLKTAFDKDAGLEVLEKLTVMRNHVMTLLEDLLLEMRACVDKLAATKPQQLTDAEARELIQKEGRLSAGAVNILQNRQTEALLDAAAEDETENRAPAFDPDDEYTVKAKLLLYIESLYCAVNIGVAL